MAACLEPNGTVEPRDFGRELHVQGIDASKKIKLKLENEGDTIIVHVELTKVRSEGEQRNVAKYLQNAKLKAMAKLNVATFKSVQGYIGQSRLAIVALWALKAHGSKKDIEEACARISDARSSMVLG